MYNGYKNYETWAVALWLNNEYGDYIRWYERARELEAKAGEIPQVEEGIWTEAEAVKFTLADEIKKAIEAGNPLANEASFYSDLMGAALSEVDWGEVANSFIEE